MGLLLQELAAVRAAPARQVLAEAIAAHRAAQADHAATLAAVEAAEQAVLDARELHDAAEAAVAAAPQEAADHAQALARGNAGPAPVSTRERREALLDAVDVLTAARSARDLLRERIPADAQRVALAEGRCKAAAVDVMRNECAGTAAELLAELARAQEATARIGRIVESLVAAQVVEGDGPAKLAVMRHTTPPCAWGWQDRGADPAAGWHATLAALQANAEAPAAVVARVQG